MALLAAEFGAVPFKKIVRRTAHACRCGEGVQALLAALLLVAEGPAQTDQRNEDERENLEEVGGVRQRGVYRPTEVVAQQKRESEDFRDLHGKEELPLDPEARSNG